MRLVILLLLLFAVYVLVRLLFRSPKGKPASPPLEIAYATPQEIEQRALELRDALSTTPFGESRAARLWAKVMAQPIDRGMILERHRDFCGHGLIRTTDGIKLCDIQDGDYPCEAIASWQDEQSFVAFFARQSDYSCSGWDAGESVFYTEDDWYRNNQRITAAKIDTFLGAAP